LTQGVYQAQERALKLVRRLPYLRLTGAVQECAETYLDSAVIPAEKRGDALQLAFATAYSKLRDINIRNGWRTPLLVSPETIPRLSLGQIIRRKFDEDD
jgi:hypothetical protein